MRSKRESRLQSEAFAREVVNDIHRTVGTAVPKAVVHKVDRPPFIGATNGRNRVSADVVNLASLSRSHLKPKSLIKPSKAVLPGARYFTARKDQKAAPAEPRPLLRMLADAFLEQRVGALLSLFLVKQRSVGLCNDSASPERGQALGVQRYDRFFALLGPSRFLRSTP
jgi:hypothetical protein